MNIPTWLFRIAVIIALLFILRTGMAVHDILIKGDIPQMQKDIQELKQQGQKYITQEQLNEAVRVRIQEELQKQSKLANP